MKGLLLKDFYMTMKYCRIYLIMIPLFWILMSSTGESFLALYPCLLFSTLPITLQNYDEKENWITYSHTLPYSTKQLVSEKYFLNLMTVLLNLALTLIGRLLQILFAPEADLEELGTILFFAFAISVVPTMIVLPVIFKFGAEKAMIAYIIVGGITGFTFSILGTFLENTVSLPEIAGNPALLTGIILVGIVILYGISWNMSIKFYAKREFA